jgi:hypothetical protein
VLELENVSRLYPGSPPVRALDLEGEVLGLAQVIAEGLLALAALPAVCSAVADHPLVRAVLGSDLN